MQKRRQIAGIITVAATAMLTALRLCFPPTGSGLQGKYIITVGVAFAALLLVYILCGAQRSATRSVASVGAKLLSGAMVFFGVSLCFASISQLINLREGIFPYPQPLSVSMMGTALVWFGVLSALFGGLFFIGTAIRWYLQGYTTRVSYGVLALLPVVWTWVRILWYMTSFSSAANRFRSLFEIAMLLFEMLFLFVFARHMAGMEENAPRFVLSTTLSAAMFGFTVCFTRFAAYLMQDAELFGNTALLAAPDLFVALLAGVFAITQITTRFYRLEETETVEEEQPASPPVEGPKKDEVVEEQPTFLLSEEELAEASSDEEEEQPAPETERKPMELEDILNEIINGTR